MGTYIAHTRRKIKPAKAEGVAEADPAAIAARERELAERREQQRAAEERARAEKAARTLMRAVEKRMSPAEPDTSGRRRTAVRAAGIVLISATGGLRTESVAMHRLPGSVGSELWRADVRFETENRVTHYINDPGSPADLDALHAMRALAPRIAEHLFMGPPFDDHIDRNNLVTAQRLAESFMHKSHYTASLAEPEKRALCRSIFDELQHVAAMRLRHLSGSVERLVDGLMHKTRLSRSELNALLASIYDGYEEFRRAEAQRGPSPPGRAAEPPAEPEQLLEDQRPAATGTHGF
ncbi:hypothetical protein [Methylosinus sp. Sm6]|uniref:hypothetical protein n=1 Tax=Methylosinus sp. Sm6 TaxID=2866948 RepID=UPI001C9A28DA|nr:hypothetical protein [Methylosinus sp. Sm6]MBY6242022.1 hypothetical protein [Methylosinus sp. Sm6]